MCRKMSVKVIGFIVFCAIGLSTQNAIDVEKRQTTTCDCGIPKVVRRIVGGSEVTPNKYPWDVALFKHDIFNGRRVKFQFCGATLISSKYVLTAAHCFVSSGYHYSECSVQLGDHNLRQTTDSLYTISRRIFSLKLHPQYNDDTHNNDIAIIQLDAVVIFSQYIRPICMPPQNFNATGKLCDVSGWGLTAENGSPSEALRYVKVPVVSQKQCNVSYGGAVTHNMICAGYFEGGKDSCQGDSGGPLTCLCNTRHVQVGVVSFGAGCAQPKYPGIYTDVSKYISFITTNIGTDKICPASCTA